MGIGSPENPYVENPYAGRIVNVHWKKDRDEQPPLSATALLEATGPTALPFPTGSFINDLLTTAVSGDSGVGIPGVGTLGPTRVIPGELRPSSDKHELPWMIRPTPCRAFSPKCFA